MKRTATVLALVATLSGLTVLTAPEALAACRQPVAPGTPLAAGGGQDPLIDRLGLRRVWELTSGGGVTVAVVDSGVDARQPKLAGAVAPPIDFRTVFTNAAGFEQGPGTGDDCVGHGTAIAGLIAARAAGDERLLGVAPDATIAPVRFDGNLPQAPPTMIAAAIRAGADRGSVMNLSFAVGVDDPDIRKAVQYAVDRDVVVVAAAGNEGQSSPGATWYPAAYDGVLAVASVDAAGQPAQDSNRGPWVDVAAPGEGLTAVSAGGGFVSVKGTSFATAVVSGVAALVRARYPEMSAQEVERRIQATAISPTGGRDDRTGAGIVDPYLAVTAEKVPPPAKAPPDTAVSVVPVPQEPPLLSPREATAAAAAAMLLGCAVVAAVAGLAARRVVARRERARGGAARGDPGRGDPGRGDTARGDPGRAGRHEPAYRPVEPVPVDRLR